MSNGDWEDGRPFQPWRLHADGHLDARRRELFAMAAPVFRRHGYRGATIKALAHACGVRPATLYHYFDSKADLANCLLRQPRIDWDSTWVDPAADPVEQLARLVDLSIAELPNYLLSLQLAVEVGGIEQPVAQKATFREGEQVFGRLVAAAAPGMPTAEAVRVARDALAAMVGSAVMGLDPKAGLAVRERVMNVFRVALVPEHFDARRFADATRAVP